MKVRLSLSTVYLRQKESGKDAPFLQSSLGLPRACLGKSSQSIPRKYSRERGGRFFSDQTWLSSLSYGMKLGERRNGSCVEKARPSFSEVSLRLSRAYLDISSLSTQQRKGVKNTVPNISHLLREERGVRLELAEGIHVRSEGWQRTVVDHLR